MAYETGLERHRSVGPTLASVLIDALLSGVTIFGIGQALTEGRIPETQAAPTDDAPPGNVKCGQR